VVFYNITRQCLVDLPISNVESPAFTRASWQSTILDFRRTSERIRELCDSRGLYLIEDCAHVLQRNRGRHPWKLRRCQHFQPSQTSSPFTTAAIDSPTNTVGMEDPALDCSWSLNLKAAVSVCCVVAEPSPRVWPGSSGASSAASDLSTATDPQQSGRGTSRPWRQNNLTSTLHRKTQIWGWTLVSRFMLSRQDISWIVRARRRNPNYLSGKAGCGP